MTKERAVTIPGPTTVKFGNGKELTFRPTIGVDRQGPPRWTVRERLFGNAQLTLSDGKALVVDAY